MSDQPAARQYSTLLGIAAGSFGFLFHILSHSDRLSQQLSSPFQLSPSFNLFQILNYIFSTITFKKSILTTERMYDKNGLAQSVLPRNIMRPYQRYKQSTFNFTHFLGLFRAYSYVEGRQKNTTQAICWEHENYN